MAANTTGTIRNVMTASAAGDPQAANNSGSAQGSAYIVAPLTATSITLRSDPTAHGAITRVTPSWRSAHRFAR